MHMAAKGTILDALCVGSYWLHFYDDVKIKNAIHIDEKNIKRYSCDNICFIVLLFSYHLKLRQSVLYCAKVARYAFFEGF